MRLRICSFAFILALLPVVWASDQQAVGTATVPYLLRMERLRSDQDVCVLVQRDGQYHLERLHPYGIRVFEGKLRNGALASLESLLMEDRLLRLQQSDIDVPLITGDLDNLFVSVLRPDHWQNLQFNSAESRKPYEEFLNPLLKWLDALQKEKAKELTEESGRNNCLPPKEIQLQTRSGDKIHSMHAEASAVTHAYILRTLTRRFDSSRIENSCVIIRDTGVYHVRRSQQLARKETKTTVLDGTFSVEAVNSLRVLIDADPLRKWPTENPPLARLQAATVTNLSIPREDGVQQITVWRYVFAPATHNIGSLRSGDLPGIDDHGTRLIRPLDEWMKRNLPIEKEIPTSNPANPQCLPEL
jgi:hypothetical protein